MAQQGAGERTEKPTHRRLTKSREQGKVPSSDELASALVLLTLIVMLWLLGPTLYSYLGSEVRRGICGSTEVFLTNKNFLDFANARIVGLMGAILPLTLGMMVAGVVGCVAVSGINFAPKALNLKFSGLNPMAGLANLFSVQSLQKLVIALAKMALIMIVSYMFVRSRLEDFVRLRWASTNEIFALSASLVFGIFVRIATAILILAIADAAYQKWKYIHDLKMTKQEVKQERREEEGSPEVKRRVRMLQIEMASRRMLQ
jgi:flagellar biosynthetic protein FlhB